MYEFPLPWERPGSVQERPGASQERPGASRERPERPGSVRERAGASRKRHCVSGLLKINILCFQTIQNQYFVSLDDYSRV